MIPAPVIAAFAPVVADYIRKNVIDTPITTTGGATAPPSTAAAPVASPTTEMLTGAVTDWLDHEKKKGSVRPRMMAASGATTIVSAVCYLVAAFAPMLGMSSLEHSAHAMEALLYVMGGGAAFYGYKHTVRSVDKSKGTA